MLFWEKIPASVMAGMMPDMVSMMVGSISTRSTMYRASHLPHESGLRGQSDDGIRIHLSG